VVSLPRKEHVSLSSNYHHAEKRFHALARRLEKDETLRNVYHDQMLNYIRHEQVEIAPPADGTEETYHLLHHLVRKEKRGNLKWRIVFHGGGPHWTPRVEVITSGRTSTRQRRRGAARTVFLRTTHGSQIARPIQLVIPLEIGTDQGGEDVEEQVTR
jgi:hypothetical protein